MFHNSAFTHFLCLSQMYDKHARDTGDMWFCLGWSEISRKQPDRLNGCAGPTARAPAPRWFGCCRTSPALCATCFLSAHFDEIMKINIDQMSLFDLNPDSCSAGAAIQYLPHYLQRVSLVAAPSSSRHASISCW